MKKFFFILGYILLLGSFSTFPPNIDYGQRVIKDSIVTKAQRIAKLEAKIERDKDSVKSNINFIKQQIKQNPKKYAPTTQKVKIIYKEKIKKVPTPYCVRDTLIVYTPVNLSEYYLEQRHYSDSLAALKRHDDSLRAAREYELKHRSIFRKIFGGKGNKIKKDNNK